MKAGKKLLAVLLSAACVTAGAFGLTACGKNDNNQTDSEIYAVYQSYVAYAEANGDEVKTYEEWLATIKGDRGPQGETGNRGPQGETGEKGADGATWLTGADDPAATSGKTGDLYLNVTTFDLFNKTAEGWTKIGNIKGADGADGKDGTDGIDGTNGTNGTNGTDGTNGTNGTDGKDGAAGAPGADGLGIADIEIEYSFNAKGEQVVVYTFKMTDGSKITKKVTIPKQLVRIFISRNDTLLWLASDIQAERYALYETYWYTEYADGSNEQVPVTEDQLIKSSIGENGLCSVRAKNNDNITLGFQVYVAENLDAVSFENAEIVVNDTVYCEKGGQPDLSSVYIRRQGSIHSDAGDDMPVTYYQPVTVDMLTNMDTQAGFSSDTCGEQSYRITDDGVEGEVRICVYTKKEVKKRVLFLSDGLRVVESGIPEIYFGLYEDIVYTFDDGSSSGTQNTLEYGVELTEDMIKNDVDFTTVGKSTAKIEYKGETYEVEFEVYDPEVTKVRDIYLFGEGDLSVQQGAQADEVVNMVVGRTIRVQYFEEVNGSTYEEVEVTEEMLDASKLNTSTPGTTNIELNYSGYTYKVPVYVLVDWSAAHLTQTLTGNVAVLALETASVTKVELYDNGYIKLYSEEQWLNDTMVLPYTLENGILTVEYEGNVVVGVAVDGETFSAYKPEGGTVYTGSLFGTDITVTIYENGLGVIEGDQMLFAISYNTADLANNKLNIYPCEEERYMLSFTISGNTITIDE